MRPGEVLGDRFEVERLIASGGMGAVYRAIDRASGSLVAIKAVRATVDSDAERRFEREVETLASLCHPGIVTYLANGKTDGELFLAMEWLDGEDLAAHLVARDLDLGETLAVATRVAAALAFAHARGVVHRDIKPSNIFLVDCRTDQVKLLDFGVARRAGLTALTATGLMVGTPSYMAPEQARGQRAIDARADVYGLGAVIFRCLCGRPPFSGETPEQLFARLLTEPAPRLRDHLASVSPELDALVARMLARDPGHRPVDGAAVSAALLGLEATSAVRAIAAAPKPVDVSPLIGRDAERAAIQQALAVPERQALQLFTGEPGLGKSRLLEQAGAEVLARGGMVFRGRAYEAEMIRPYGAWIDALRSRPLGGTEDADLAPLLPELGASAEKGDRSRLFDAVVRHLAGLADTLGPIAILLDDLQWFDEASVALLHFAVRGLDRRQVLLASAARPAELEDNRVAASMVRDLRRDRRLAEWPLAPLATEEIAALVEAERGDVDAARVFAESEGNPLFALEVARARRLGQELGDAVSLAGLLDDRLARLDDRVRELVPWAAALGRSFDLETLARVSGQPFAALVSAAAALERRGVIRVAAAAGTEARYDFAHDLLRQAAYRQLSVPRRRLVHLQIAHALAAPRLSESVAGDVVHHAALGGDAELGVRAAILAAERSLRIFANNEAAELADRGLELLSRLPRPTAIPHEIALYDVIARARRPVERAGDLEAAVARAVVEARGAGLDEAVQRGLWVLSIAGYARHDYDSAFDASMQMAAPAAGADVSTRVMALAGSGRCLVTIERDLDRAEDMLLEARALATAQRLAPIDVPLGLGILRYVRGDHDGAAPLLVEAWRAAQRVQDHWRCCEALSYLVRVDLEARRIDRALERCAELGPVASRMGEGSEAPFAEALAAAARYLGPAEVEETAAALEQAMARLAELDCKHQLAYVLNLAAAGDLERGAVERARARAERALGLAEVVNSSEASRARSLLARLTPPATEAP